MRSSHELEDCADNIDRAEESDDDAHQVVDEAYDAYESVLEELKTTITAAVAEVDDHLKLCSDVRSVLEQLAVTAQKPWP
jgi:DNA-binding ferritin-like protein